MTTSQSWHQAVVTIVSRDPSHKLPNGETVSGGTGFVVHKTGEATYFLTCAHVVRDVGGPEMVMVKANRRLYPAKVVAMGSDGKKAEDIALLVINQKLELPVLGLRRVEDEPAKVSKFNSAGTFMSIPGAYEIKPIQGELTGLLQFGSLHAEDGSPVWILSLDKGSKILPWCSGAPVYHPVSGQVVGIIIIQNDVQEGRGLSLAALPYIWQSVADQIPQALRDQLRDSVPLPTSENVTTVAERAIADLPVAENSEVTSQEALDRVLQNQQAQELEQQTKQTAEKPLSQWNYLLIELSPEKEIGGVNQSKFTIAKMLWLNTRNIRSSPIKTITEPPFEFTKPEDISRFMQLVFAIINKKREVPIKQVILKIFLPHYLIADFNIQDWKVAGKETLFGQSCLIVYQISSYSFSDIGMGYLDDKYGYLCNPSSNLKSKMKLLCRAGCEKGSCPSNNLESEKVFCDKDDWWTSSTITSQREEHYGVIITDTPLSSSKYLEQIYEAGTPIFIWPRQPVSSQAKYTARDYCHKLAELLKNNDGQHFNLLKTLQDMRTDTNDLFDLTQHFSIIWQDPKHLKLVSSTAVVNGK